MAPPSHPHRTTPPAPLSPPSLPPLALPLASLVLICTLPGLVSAQQPNRNPTASPTVPPPAPGSDRNPTASQAAGLTAGFYSRSCPKAWSIIRLKVAEAIQQNPRVGAQLLRLHFHDCFVNGCDGSVLLDSQNGEPSEKDAEINNTLAGFEVVDDIKAALESTCPGVVSCADLLTIASRHAVSILGGPAIQLRMGRRDGLRSVDTDADSLPVFTPVRGLIRSFEAQGLNVTDMVVLSGAHTIGVAHCLNVEGRIPPFRASKLLTPEFRKSIADRCLINSELQPNVTLPLDKGTEFVFDNQYYKNLQNREGLLITDSILSRDSRTSALVATWAADQAAFFRQFTISMVKMSEISPLVGRSGEVRRNCRVINKK